MPSEEEDLLELNSAFSLATGAVLNELEARLIHMHPLFLTDNATLFSMLEEATRSTIYTSIIKSIICTKNHRAAYYALINSHARQDKWKNLLKEKIAFLMNIKWSCRQYSLKNPRIFIAAISYNCRNANIMNLPITYRAHKGRISYRQYQKTQTLIFVLLLVSTHVYAY